MAGVSTSGSLEVVEEADTLKSVGGYTWPGIEYGEAPSCRFNFFQYIDALRAGELRAFLEIERDCGEWWDVSIDRGAGAALHFAVDAGQLACVKFLVEARNAQVNQQTAKFGWTPLHHCARMAHYRHAPYLQIFQYLLEQGADPRLCTWLPDPQAKTRTGQQSLPLDMAVNKGKGWQPGEVRAELQQLVDQHAQVARKPAFTYHGPGMGATAATILSAWQQLPPRYPPANWRPPPAAGHLDACGMRPVSRAPWRAAGTEDGSCFLRPMTDVELAEQSRLVAAA